MMSFRPIFRPFQRVATQSALFETAAGRRPLPAAEEFVRRSRFAATNGVLSRSYSVTSPILQSSNQPSQKPNSPPPMVEEDFSKMTNEELMDTSTIPGWDLIHSPPGKMPRGSLVGTVVSTKMQKTVNVAVDRYRIVPKIRKRVKYTRKFMAHDENEVANLGDLVMIEPCHRLSKMKHFLLSKIVRPKGQLKADRKAAAKNE